MNQINQTSRLVGAIGDVASACEFSHRTLVGTPIGGALANVGSDVARAHRWQEKDPQLCEKAFVRALELLDVAIGDARWKGRRKELTPVRELLCDAMLGRREYGSDRTALNRYFYPFAVAARAGR